VVKTARGRWLRMGEHGVEISRALFVPKWLQRCCLIHVIAMHDPSGEGPVSIKDGRTRSRACVVLDKYPATRQKRLSAPNYSIACVVLTGEKES
jgi:hypothetical protein